MKTKKVNKSITHCGGIPSFIGGHKVGTGVISESVTKTGGIPSFIGSGHNK